MIIAIDANEANIKKRVGSNQFAFEVIWEMYKEMVDGRWPMVNKFLIFLSKKPRADFPPETDWWKYEVFGPRRFWTWTGLTRRLYWGKLKPDVLFSPSHYGPLFSPIPHVISIMDLGFLRWPEQFTKKDFYQLKYWTKWSVKRAKKIIAISEFTKRDIIKTYRIDPDRVIVAYPGYKKTPNPKFQIPNSYQAPNSKFQKLLGKVKKKYEIKGKYILYLGTLKPSKNIEGLLEAFKLLIPPLKLVIAGKKGWLYQQIFEKVRQLGLKNRVLFPGFIPDEEVPILIEGAEVFVMPSFWEGFGIPVLEAMDAGVPVVCSDRGALPEIVGDAALLTNPDKPTKIAKAIEKVLFDVSVRDKLVKSGKERVKSFSWEKCSKIILDSVVKLAS